MPANLEKLAVTRGLEKVSFCRQRSSQSYVFSNSHVRMWELNHKESLVPKNRCFWTVVLEKTLESPLDCKEIQLVHPKGNQSWIFTGRTDAECLILWPPDANNWLIGKDPDAGKDWRQEEKGTTEDEMVEWHHRHDGHEFEQAPRVGDEQGSLACCSTWGHEELDMTEQLNELNEWWCPDWLLPRGCWMGLHRCVKVLITFRIWLNFGLQTLGRNSSH